MPHVDKSIVVTGDRRFNDTTLVYQTLSAGTKLLGLENQSPNLDEQNYLTVINGAARGLDTIAHQLITSHPYINNVQTLSKQFPAQWKKYGKRAGYIRNQEMLEQNPDLVIGFPLHTLKLAPNENPYMTSRGTWNCINKAIQMNLPTLVLWNKALFPANESAEKLLAEKSTNLGPHGQVKLNQLI